MEAKDIFDQVNERIAAAKCQAMLYADDKLEIGRCEREKNHAGACMTAREIQAEESSRAAEMAAEARASVVFHKARLQTTELPMLVILLERAAQAFAQDSAGVTGFDSIMIGHKSGLAHRLARFFENAKYVEVGK